MNQRSVDLQCTVFGAWYSHRGISFDLFEVLELYTCDI